MLHQIYSTPFLPRSGSVKPHWWPEPRAHRYAIDPLAFIAALIAAPILVAVLTFWVLFIPVYALILGWPVYLLIGTPLLVWFIPRYGVNAVKIGALAFFSLSLLLVFAAGQAVFGSDANDIEMTLFYAGFGAIFAPAWGAAFGALYPWFERSAWRARNGR